MNVNNEIFDCALKHFVSICAIPHGSGNTSGATAYCLNWAKSHGFESIGDESGNVIIKIPASSGAEGQPPVALQGHLDMVLAKEADCTKDLLKEAIEIVNDGEYISAKGTTLGADDGIGVAYALALGEFSLKFAHPALELIFTTDEETGMFGAKALDMNRVESDMLINIDNEDEGILIAGCAGGARLDASKSLEFEHERFCVKISLGGFEGGHSGSEIDKGHLNAIRSLCKVMRGLKIRLASLNGGSADNAIPTDCEAVIAFDAAILETVNQRLMWLQSRGTEPGMKVNIESAGMMPVLSVDDSKSIIEAVCSVDNGVIAMSNSIENLVETSANTGVISTVNGKINVTHSIRSSSKDAMEEIYSSIKENYERFSFSLDRRGDYPAWEFKEQSVLRDVTAAAYKDLTGKDLLIEGIHAGLECGVFCSKKEDLDCISIGPDITGAHTPAERMSIESANRTLDLIVLTLERLAENENHS